MIKAILLDLDNTLIQNDDRPFALALLEKFEAYFRHHLGKDGAAQALRAGLKQLRTTRPRITSNRVQLVQTLAEHLQVDVSNIDPIFEGFYREQYPSLADYVHPIEGAHDLVLRMVDAGYAIVIATNPIYPHEAIMQRMMWGQLPTELEHYALITSADNMHYSKPHPAYYAEIVARVGLEPDEAVILGDSFRNDIEAGHKAGLFAYCISDDERCHEGNRGRSFADFEDWLAEHRNQQVVIKHWLTPDIVMNELLGNLGAMYGLLQDVQDNFWHQRPDDNEWSIVQILCHLWHYENQHERSRLERILAEDSPFIVAPQSPGPNIDVCDNDGFSVAKQFAEARYQTLEFLRGLSDEQWHRPARHSIFGFTNLIEMAHFTAQHDRLHLNQLCQTIGRCE
jgi:HAD superfamily hydrolase (TIGR01549 family)